MAIMGGPLQRRVTLRGNRLMACRKGLEGIDQAGVLVKDGLEVLEAPVTCEMMDGRDQRQLVGVDLLGRRASYEEQEDDGGVEHLDSPIQFSRRDDRIMRTLPSFDSSARIPLGI